MKRIIRLTESDLARIVRRVLNEEECLKTPEWLENFTIGQSKINVVCNNLTWFSGGYENETGGFKVLVNLETMELEVTILSMDDILDDLESISDKQTYSTLGYPQFKYKFSSSEENGDLNNKLNEIKDILLSSNILKESYRRRYRRY